MAVKVKFDPKAAADDLFKKVDRIKRRSKMNDEIGAFVVKRIRGEARRGKPLNDGRKFRSLADLTKKNRERLSKFNKTHPSFAPSKSNLTFSGQLIDAVQFKDKRGAVVIDIDDNTRKPVKTSPGKRSKNPPTNKELQSLLIKISKSFKLFSKKGIEGEKKVTKRVKGIVLKHLRRSLKRS